MGELIIAGSVDVKAIDLLVPLPIYLHIYVWPFLILYPLAGYVYYARYDDFLGDQANTFLLCVALFTPHALSWLGTRWSTTYRAKTMCRPAHSLGDAKLVRVHPQRHRGQGQIVPLARTPRPGGLPQTFFSYQRDKFVYNDYANTFARTTFPADEKPFLSTFQRSTGQSTVQAVSAARADFGKNHFDIPVPTFQELFAEHAVAPFFVFQLFCVGLWCLDEYWYYSIFTLFMLVIFECTTVFQRLKTLGEFRTMSIKPFAIQCCRSAKWQEIQTDDLVPGDLVSILRSKDESAIPCDLLLLEGTCVVNEAMLSGESTPLLKESIALRPASDRLDIAGVDRNSVLFGGTKALQTTSNGQADGTGPSAKSPDGGCLAIVLRTGFGTTQGQLVRTMIFSTDRVTANNMEAFLFIAFLLVFAIAASTYVWIKGVQQQRPRMKLMLDCVLIITSVVPPELPMELALAVNTSLIALSKLAIFCTEPFRIPLAGRVDVCCFDKTGTITGEDLVVEGIAGLELGNEQQLAAVGEVPLDTTLTIAAAHALVLMDDGVVGDPMEKTALEALAWQLTSRDTLAPRFSSDTIDTTMAVSTSEMHVTIKRRFQFSSALKRMSTVSTIGLPTQKKQTFVAVKGAPETLRSMFLQVPSGYEATYRHFAQRGSRVLALGCKRLEGHNDARIVQLQREAVESSLTFAGFLVFNCPIKPDAVQTIKDLNDASHRCIMITGDNPLTAIHVAKAVEIVDRDVLILDSREGALDATNLVLRDVKESKDIPFPTSTPLNQDLIRDHDLCLTGSAIKAVALTPIWRELVQQTWIYARVSPTQKEHILATLKDLGYTTLMAGDGTNDVGALKRAHIGVALLNGSPELLKKIAEKQMLDRLKKVYEQQLKIADRFKQPPPPVPKALEGLYPELASAQKAAAEKIRYDRARGITQKFDLDSITSRMAETMEEEDAPVLKLGDASVAAPFTSKLSNVVAVSNIIRQGRCTLVATIQMYKILALNCLISAYSLSVMYLDGIKFGDYQVTITGMLMSICFLTISRARPAENLSRERPLTNIFNPYLVLSVLLQFAVHIAALLYITRYTQSIDPPTEQIDLEGKFKPSLLNSAIYLLSTSQQISTFAVNFIGRPFRENIRENSMLYHSLLAVAAVAVNGATDFVPEINRWLQLTEMSWQFRATLCVIMLLDYSAAWVIEIVLKRMFGQTFPRGIVTVGEDRRILRRALEDRERLRARTSGEADTRKAQ